MINEYKGYNGILVLTDTGVVIKRGARGFLLGGGMLRGDKTIPYTSIVAVQHKKAGITAGYIQLSIKGGAEAKGGLFQSTSDENTINFHSGKNVKFLEAKQYIEEQINGSKTNVSSGGINDLEKLAELKAKGIITQGDFDAKKKQLLEL